MSPAGPLSGSRGVAIGLAAAVVAAVAVGGTVAYYRHAVIGPLEVRLAEERRARQDLEGAAAALTERLHEARDESREVTEAAADRLDRDRSAALGMADRARAGLRECREARQRAEGAVADLEGQLGAARDEAAALRRQVARSDAVGLLLGKVREVEDRRVDLVEERAQAVASVSALGPELVEADRQCVVQGPESAACAEASRLHREEGALRDEIAFLRERIAALDDEIARYQEGTP